MLGQTIEKVVPITIVLAVVFTLLAFLALQLRRAVVAQARDRH